MALPLSGPGVGLPLPQNLYPTSLQNAPQDLSTNRYSLNAGDELPIPAGDWYIDLGMYLTLEFMDPVTSVWMPGVAAGWTGGVNFVKSDGFNVRVANRLGCPISAVVSNAGSSYVQASTTISVTGGGGSTWLPIVGGGVTVSAATIVTAQAGAGYGVPPIIIFPAPPPASNNANGVGGIPASGYVGIASGTIAGFTFNNVGAGYTGTTFNVVGLPNPTDPNLATGITLGTIGMTVGFSGSIMAALCTNSGSAISNPANITLTVTGAGTNATVTPILPQTVITASIVGGSTIGELSGSLALITSVGGYPNKGTLQNNPPFLFLEGRPRPAQIAATVGGVGTIAAQVATIYDGGYFYAAPVPVLVGAPIIASTGTVIGSSTVLFTMGSVPDIVKIQPAP